MKADKAAGLLLETVRGWITYLDKPNDKSCYEQLYNLRGSMSEAVKIEVDGDMLEERLLDDQAKLGLMKEYLRAWIKYMSKTEDSHEEVKMNMYGAITEALMKAEKIPQ